MKISKAVYAGSFDMPTNGHDHMIQRASRMVDELVVAVGVNPAKKTMFSIETRTAMLQDLAAQYPNVVVDSFTRQYLVNYAFSIGAQFIVRGLRNTNDFIVEQTMMQENLKINPGVETIFIIAEREYADISSSVVKSLVGPVGWEQQVRGHIPHAIQERFFSLVDEDGNIRKR